MTVHYDLTLAASVSVTQILPLGRASLLAEPLRTFATNDTTSDVLPRPPGWAIEWRLRGYAATCR